MDIVTHALLGALAATVARASPRRRTVALSGAIGACFPDLDVLIRSSSDPLLVLEYHRHFSHSLLFSPLGAALAALLLWPVIRRHLTLAALYQATLAGYVSACLLDVFTSYGTHLLWPLFPHPIALNLIAVVDPVFTLAILLGLLFVLKGYRDARRYALLPGAIYLCICSLQFYRAEQAAKAWSVEHFSSTQDVLVKPTLGNILLWRALVSDQDTVQAIGVRVGFGAAKIYAGERAQRFRPTDLPLPEGSRALRDLQRFYRFSNAYLVAYPGETGEIGDVRYAMLPTSVVPLWGISIDPHHPEAETQFITRRDTRAQVRQQFLQMLAGRSLHDTLPRE